MWGSMDSMPVLIGQAQLIAGQHTPSHSPQLGIVPVLASLSCCLREVGHYIPLSRVCLEITLWLFQVLMCDEYIILFEPPALLCHWQFAVLSGCSYCTLGNLKTSGQRQTPSYCGNPNFSFKGVSINISRAPMLPSNTRITSVLYSSYQGTFKNIYL